METKPISNGWNKLYTQFLSPENNWLIRLLNVGLTASLDGGVRTGRGSLMNFVGYNLNVPGDGIWCCGEHSEWPYTTTKVGWARLSYLCWSSGSGHSRTGSRSSRKVEGGG